MGRQRKLYCLTLIILLSISCYAGVSSNSGVINGTLTVNKIVGGQYNTVDGDGSSICGGTNNIVSDRRGFIGGGNGNDIEYLSYSSSIVGGKNNLIEAYAFRGFIGGGYGNNIDRYAEQSVIVGGTSNDLGASALRSALVGGQGNIIKGRYSFLGGGLNNTTGVYAANGKNVVVGGGELNTSTGNYSSIVGGYNNKVGGIGSFTVGSANNVQGDYSAALGEGLIVTLNNTTAIEALLLNPSLTPNNAVSGLMFYHSGQNVLKCYNGSSWNNLF